MWNVGILGNQLITKAGRWEIGSHTFILTNNVSSCTYYQKCEGNNHFNGTIEIITGKTIERTKTICNHEICHEHHLNENYWTQELICLKEQNEIFYDECNRLLELVN